MKKKCIGDCKRILEVIPANFPRVAANRDGFDNRCKICRNRMAKEYRAKRGRFKTSKTYEYDIVGYNGLSEIYC